jgi:hypothetical protein
VEGKLNGTCQLLAHADNMNLLGDDRYINNKKESLIFASEKGGIEINVEKTKYTMVTYYQNAGQNRDMEIANRSFENVSQFKYLGKTVIYENLIHDKIKRGLKSGNACYHSIQNRLSSRVLSKNVQKRKYKPIVSCYSVWVDNLVLKLRKEHNLMVCMVEEHYPLECFHGDIHYRCPLELCAM